MCVIRHSLNPLLDTQGESRALVFDLYPLFSVISYEPHDFEGDGKLGLLSADVMTWSGNFSILQQCNHFAALMYYHKQHLVAS